MKKQSLSHKSWRLLVNSTFSAFTIAICLLAFAANGYGQNTTQTFTNSTPIAISDGGTTSGTGNPYPSTITVTGFTGNVVDVNVTLNGLTHTFPDDIGLMLVAPNNSFMVIQSDAGGGADVTNLTYTFDDQATAQIANAGPLVAGTYRPSSYGDDDLFPLTGTNPPPADCQPAGECPQAAPAGTATMNGTFAGSPANGTWRLYAIDCCAQDTGGFTGGWSITITAAGGTPVVPAKPILDFFGSGRTSFATIGAQGSNYVWRLQNNGGTGAQTVLWGLTTDVPTPGYYDGDNRADVAVWRANADPTQNFYFIRQSTNSALRAHEWGISTDLPGREADYDGDGIDDLTVLRRVNGQWHWIYLASATNTSRTIPFGTANGTATEDVPITGADYAGDGRADLVVIRQNTGADDWIVGDSNTGLVTKVERWGEFNTDFFVLGDYLGDSKYDFAVWRAAGTGGDFGNWFIKENGGSATLVRNFGIPSGTAANRDVAVAGDYNGDGKSDIAVYRRSNATFYWLQSPAASAFSAQQFGVAGDFPVPGLRAF